MKKLLATQILAALLLAPLSFAEIHEFKSADGAKTIRAEIAAYDMKTGIATLTLESSGRQIYAPLNSFSEEDQTYIKKAGFAMAAGRSLGVRFADKEEIVSEKKNPTNGFQTLGLKAGYGIDFRNNGTAGFTGMQVDYQIFYKAYLDPFESRERTEKVVNGSFAVPDLEPGKEEAVLAAASSVGLTRIRQLPKSECTGGT